MRKLRFGLAAALVGSLVATAAFAAVKSGLQVGQGTTAFQVVDVSGPNKGKQLCYR